MPGQVLVKEGTIVLPKVANAGDYVILEGIKVALPIEALWAIFAVIVLAAVMSTTDRLMLTIGAMFSWDIYKKILKPDAPDAKVLTISKIVVVLSALVTMLLAINPPEMLAILIWMGIGTMLGTFAVPLLAGLYWRGATREGALASMSLGLVTALLFGFLNYFKVEDNGDRLCHDPPALLGLCIHHLVCCDGYCQPLARKRPQRRFLTRP